ncbi:MAG: hypothetical protein WAV72_20405, partial [Bradyrhizobium sp.]
TVARGKMAVAIDDEGKTRMRHIYTASAPIAGKALRISHPLGEHGISRHVGDPVTADETVVAVMQPHAVWTMMIWLLWRIDYATARQHNTALTYRTYIIPMAFLAATLGAFSIAISAWAVPASAAELQQERVLLAMMDEMGKMSKGGGMGGTAGGQPGAQMGGATGGMSGTNSGGVGGMDSMCCMGAMGKAPGAGSAMAMPSALPGFAGASHLYHVGASGFFLDYANKIGLSVEQTTALNGIKQRSLLEQSAAQRKNDEAEQALWILTAADQPDAAAIEAKVREIEKIKSDARLVFARAVGEAAKVLNAEQQKMVLGMAPMPATAPMKTMAK